MRAENAAAGGNERAHYGHDRDPARARIPDRVRARGADAYDPRRERPLVGYTALTALFGAVAAGGYAALAAAGKAPRRPSAARTVRLGIATHKLARMIAKDKVTSPYRAPFSRFEGEADAPAELSETPRGSGLRYAVGELLGCPYCLAPWLATGLLYAEEAAPGPTGTLTSVLEAVTVADFLQVLYKGSENKLL
jgi:hypothetical protein